jgi:hypothetical protein
MLTFVFCPAPRSVVHRRVSDASFWAIRRVDAFGRGSDGGRFHPHVLAYANMLRVRTELAAASDRDYRRPIPRDVWEAFTPRLRRLLRFATVESGHPDEVANAASLRESIAFVAEAGMLTVSRLADRLLERR